MQTNLEYQHQDNDLSYLAKEWRKTFNCRHPIGAHSTFLSRAISWQSQAQRLGGLTASEKKALLGNTTLPESSVNIGSNLIRVWQGETHQVTVLEDGYQYSGKHWTSLSAIARAITGTPWSGPVFFGLKK